MIKRLVLSFLGTLLLVLACTGTVGATDVNNFTILDFQADYYLGRSVDGRSTLKTVENIMAEFPEYDQNHGIERAIPIIYDDHLIDLDIQSVTDRDGNKLPYTTYTSSGNEVIRIGDANTYVHGVKTYVITYKQQDVTRYFSDTNQDEFYWDVNGTGWSQTFSIVTARLHIDKDIASLLTNNQSCYRGYSGSNESCSITRYKDTFTARAVNLGSFQNMTIAVGFKPHTFLAHKMSIAELVERYKAVATIAFGAVIIVILYILRTIKGKDAPGRGTIVPEYLPPTGVDIALSSLVRRKSKNWVAATYVDLAVRHNIKIIQRTKKAYGIEFVSAEGLSVVENQVVNAVFGENPQRGDRFDIDADKTNSKLVTELSSIYRIADKTAQSSGYFIVNKTQKRIMYLLTILAAIPIVVTWYLPTVGIKTLYDGWAIIMPFVYLVVGFWLTFSMKPLSGKGRELYDYLKGLEHYIKIAEEDRIKLMQSPKGAEKTPVDTNDKTFVLHLYERVLPYAVLFGNEKEWVKVIGSLYEQGGVSPDWYVGDKTFSAALFASSLSGFSSHATNNSYSSPSSSSSGGSFGGGSSGGGGGGGGGGGW